MIADTINKSAPFTFPLIWCIACFIISKISGWSALAKRNPDTAFESGKTFWFCSVKFGESFFGARYGNCVFLNVGDDGIRFSVLFLFRVGHPPMFISWDKINSLTAKRFLFADYYRIHLDGQVILLMGMAGDFVNKKFREIKKLGPFIPEK